MVTGHVDNPTLISTLGSGTGTVVMPMLATIGFHFHLVSQLYGNRLWYG